MNPPNKNAESICQLLPLSDDAVPRNQADNELGRKQRLSKLFAEFNSHSFKPGEDLRDDSPSGNHSMFTVLSAFIEAHLSANIYLAFLLEDKGIVVTHLSHIPDAWQVIGTQRLPRVSESKKCLRSNIAAICHL